MRCFVPVCTCPQPAMQTYRQYYRSAAICCPAAWRILPCWVFLFTEHLLHGICTKYRTENTGSFLLFCAAWYFRLRPLSLIHFSASLFKFLPLFVYFIQYFSLWPFSNQMCYSSAAFACCAFCFASFFSFTNALFRLQFLISVCQGARRGMRSGVRRQAVRHGPRLSRRGKLEVLSVCVCCCFFLQ